MKKIEGHFFYLSVRHVVRDAVRDVVRDGVRDASRYNKTILRFQKGCRKIRISKHQTPFPRPQYKISKNNWTTFCSAFETPIGG